MGHQSCERPPIWASKAIFFSRFPLDKLLHAFLEQPFVGFYNFGDAKDLGFTCSLQEIHKPRISYKENFRLSETILACNTSFPWRCKALIARQGNNHNDIKTETLVQQGDWDFRSLKPKKCISEKSQRLFNGDYGLNVQGDVDKDVNSFTWIMPRIWFKERRWYLLYRLPKEFQISTASSCWYIQ